MNEIEWKVGTLEIMGGLKCCCISLVKEIAIQFTDWLLLAYNQQVTNVAASFSLHLTLDLIDAKSFKNEGVGREEISDFGGKG